MEKHDVIIIGAGIVGLASAFQVLKMKPGLKVAVLDKEKMIAAHQTGHNSGVIHSGIYYKPGSLKARNCKEGVHRLMEFCDSYGVNHEICGKVIVATLERERPLLDVIYNRGIENGLKGIARLTPEEIRQKEPHVHGVEGIWVPQAGIINYSEVAAKLKELVEEMGGEVFMNNEVKNIHLRNGQAIIQAGEKEFLTAVLVNCAGLYSDKIAKMTMPAIDIQILPFRGEYYKLKKEKEYLIKNLVYPVPNPQFPFLGVHFTRMIKGGIEAGPNAVLAFRREGYNRRINWKEFRELLFFKGFRKITGKYWREGLAEQYRSFSKKAFTKALQRLVPEIRKEDLISGGLGVRAQACDSKGNLIDDFLIYENQQVINICNAPSPAATASLSIGAAIAEKILKRF